MKLKNVKVGQVVKIKKTLSLEHTFRTFEYRSKGRVGTVRSVEPLGYDGGLTVQVKFPDGSTDWGNHKDIKLLEDVD